MNRKKQFWLPAVQLVVFASVCFTLLGCGQKNALSRTESEKQTIGTAAGSIISADSHKFVIKSKNKKITFQINENTVDATENAMEVGDYVTVIYQNKSDQKLATDISLKERTVQGTVLKAKAGKIMIAAETDGKTQTFSFDQQTNGETKVQQLSRKATVIITYVTTQQGNYATSVNLQNTDSSQ